MSTYLLLRNNKESGPFTMDEIRRITLKAYDLVWVEGKSAAWRYPGEIPEFASFAPPVPEQPYDRFFTKSTAESALKDNKPKQPDCVDNRTDTNGSRQPLYINMPASENKVSGFTTVGAVLKTVELNGKEPLRNAENMIKTPAGTKQKTGRGLLIACVILLFVAGMFTGFFISYRGNFYTTDGNLPHMGARQIMAKDFPQSGSEPSVQAEPSSTTNTGDKNQAVLSSSVIRSASKTRKKSAISAPGRKDSLQTAIIPLPVSDRTDSTRLKQDVENQKLVLAAKIKARPEDYLPVTSGKYKVGMLGGISEVSLTITNRSGAPIDLVVVAVDYILHNKKIFKTEYVRFQNLGPGTTATAEAPKSPRGIRISYRITVANAPKIGLSYSNQ